MPSELIVNKSRDLPLPQASFSRASANGRTKATDFDRPPPVGVSFRCLDLRGCGRRRTREQKRGFPSGLVGADFWLGGNPGSKARTLLSAAPRPSPRSGRGDGCQASPHAPTPAESAAGKRLLRSIVPLPSQASHRLIVPRFTFCCAHARGEDDCRWCSAAGALPIGMRMGVPPWTFGSTPIHGSQVPTGASLNVLS